MKIDRLMALIIILLERDTISARELAERLEVSRRTVYRDIDTLTVAGLPIFTQEGAAGGVGLMKAYKMDKLPFTQRDIQALLASLQSYRQLFGRRELTYVLEKLNALRRENGADMAEADRFAVDLSLNRGNESLRGGLGAIETAMNESRYLAFDYADRDGRLSSRRVEPYRVVFKESKWYLQAYCTQRADYRIFKLARMQGLRVLPDVFARRDFEPLPMDGGAWMNRERTVEVKIRIQRSAVDRVIERFGESHVLELGEETCLAIYPIANDAFGYDKLLAFGDKCEVLEPPEVRAGFRDYIRRIGDKYERS